MAEIQHDLAWEWYFSSSKSGMSGSKGSRIIPCYLLKNPVVRHLDLLEKGFNTSGWISRVFMEVGPHLDLTTFTPLKIFLWPGLLSRGVSVCLCIMEWNVWKHNSCSYLQIIQSNKNMLKYSSRIYAFIYSILKSLVSKFQNITRLILSLILVPKWSRQAVSLY